MAAREACRPRMRLGWWMDPVTGVWHPEGRTTAPWPAEVLEVVVAVARHSDAPRWPIDVAIAGGGFSRTPSLWGGCLEEVLPPPRDAEPASRVPSGAEWRVWSPRTAARVGAGAACGVYEALVRLTLREDAGGAACGR